MNRAEHRQVVIEQADRFEPRLERAAHRAFERLRSKLSINTLALAISAKSITEAMRHVSAAKVDDAFVGMGGIIIDAHLRGRKVGLKQAA